MVQPYLTPEQINSLYPVIGARLYRGGLVLLRLNLSPFDGTRRRGERGKIRFLSKQSRAKLLLLATTNARKFRSLITLTYGIDYPLEGARVKRDLNKMLTRLRQVYPDFEYLWFLEFQRRGAPHIHVLASLDEPDDTARLWFAGLWANIACGGVDAPYVALDVSGGRLVGGARVVNRLRCKVVAQ